MKTPQIKTELPGPNARNLIALDKNFVSPSYTRGYPLVAEKGQGAWIHDVDGNEFLDFTSGIAVCATGHCHPRIVQAIKDQSDLLLHMSGTDFYYQPQIFLAEKLASLVSESTDWKVYFGNSGAESVEAAFKLARWHTTRELNIAFFGAFHGRTMATLSATGQDKIKQGFDPVLEGFDFVPFDDVEMLKKQIGSSTCAVMIEPIQGEGGVRSPDSNYFKAIRKICDDAGVLLILDEIQTGMGRTGKLFAYEHFGIEPDIMTLAKALANGLPIGAMLAKDQIASAFGPGAHATTFGGTPIVTSAALEVCKVLEDEGLMNSLPAGAVGSVAIYSGKGQATHVIRKVMIRMDAYLNFISPL